MRFAGRHLYDAVILVLILALTFVTVQNRTRERIIIHNSRGETMVYDRPALERFLRDLQTRDDIDLELDHAWVELAALQNPKTTAILQRHLVKIKELQGKLK